MIHAGTVLAGDSNGAMLRGERDAFVGGISLSPAEQRRRALPNHVINFLPGRPHWVTPPAVATLKRRIKRPLANGDAVLDDLMLVLGDLDEVAGYAYEKTRQRLSGLLSDDDRTQPDFYTALLRMEHAPNPDSRIELTDERDPLGMHRVAVNWHLAEGEKGGVRQTVERAGEVLGAMSIGRLQLPDWLADEDAPFPSWIDGDYHHIGSTRMSDTPATGVVDWNGRVHDVPNLYVAGSSTFHTGGSANPTLTIVAMALRLGDHLIATAARPSRDKAFEALGDDEVRVARD